MGNDGTPPPAGTGQPPAPDVTALQTQIADSRAALAVLLGRELKADETPGTIAASVIAERTAASQRALEMRLGIAETTVRSDYRPALDLSVVFGVIANDPQYAPLVEKKDWSGVIEAAAKTGLFAKAPPPAPGAAPVPPPIRPPTAPPDGGPTNKFAHVKTAEDLRKLSPTEMVTFKRANPEKFQSLTRM